MRFYYLDNIPKVYRFCDGRGYARTRPSKDHKLWWSRTERFEEGLKADRHLTLQREERRVQCHNDSYGHNTLCLFIDSYANKACKPTAILHCREKKEVYNVITHMAIIPHVYSYIPHANTAYTSTTTLHCRKKCTMSLHMSKVPYIYS